VGAIAKRKNKRGELQLESGAPSVTVGQVTVAGHETGDNLPSGASFPRELATRKSLSETPSLALQVSMPSRSLGFAAVGRKQGSIMRPSPSRSTASPFLCADSAAASTATLLMWSAAALYFL
jgi:hypothetical protein